MASLILFSLLFVLPFIVLPFGVSHFETPKVIAAEILIGILVCLRYKEFVKNHLFDTDTKKILIGFFILALIQLLSSFNQQAFLGNVFRLQGIFLFWLLIGLGFISSKVKTYLPPNWLILGLLLIQLYFAVFGDVTISGRSVGTVGEPNALAAVAVFTWSWMVMSKSKTKPTSLLNFFLLLLGLITTVLIILLSGSRSGLIALAIQIVFLATHFVRFLSLGKRVILCLFLLFATTLVPLFDTKTVYENRGEIWQTALIAGYEHPITGWGIGNVEGAFKAYNKKLYNRLQGYYVDSSHNFVLDWWVQGGFMGLALIVLLLVNRFRTFIRETDTHGLLILFGLLTVLAFNPVSVATLVQFWWLMGVQKVTKSTP